jgi:2-polyprenyl-3-methyl-5-hydroxy-6-metoxy-1,4-benzoquinol methylase
MNQIHPQFGVAMTPSQYATEWERSAAAFSSAGHYKWMSKQLGKSERVIEVGCGSGASTEALLNDGRYVLAIESNRHCADLALQRLKEKGISAEEITVEQLSQLPLSEEARLQIVVADVLSLAIDQISSGTFDAIVCWMTGTHPHHISQALNKPYTALEKSDMALYRSNIQERCYELGTRVLKSEGVVHVVDRAAIRSWSDKDWMREELVKLHRSMADTKYHLDKSDCYVRRITEGLNHSAIQYVVQLPPGATSEIVLTSAVVHIS